MAQESALLTFEEFYTRHFKWLFVRMVLAGLDRQEGRDVAQETMLRLYRKWSDLDGDSSEEGLKFYALTTAQRIRADQVDRAVRQRDGLAKMAPLVRVAEENAYARTEALDVLRALDEDDREVMSLVYDGLRVCEIAERLGRNASTVRSQLKKARETMQALLAHEKETDHGR
ncbi:sigma-70 family RNA polymerase sigma factor [Actinoplanes sp. NPDC049596]|uniref:RNA polymerase sigma factor n=1 Tax=unclassified Actinoplanes TaxID=2626549 RepID=UPI003442A810